MSLEVVCLSLGFFVGVGAALGITRVLQGEQKQPTPAAKPAVAKDALDSDDEVADNATSATSFIPRGYKMVM
jgi:hypothetical protein